MFSSKLIMEVLPNIHLIALFVVTLTVVFRQKALYPLYVFVFITGLYAGFAPWWVPYLYIWAVLWAAIMLIPKKTPLKWRLGLEQFYIGLDQNFNKNQQRLN